MILLLIPIDKSFAYEKPYSKPNRVVEFVRKNGLSVIWAHFKHVSNSSKKGDEEDAQCQKIKIK